MIIHFNSILTQAMLIVSNLKMIIIDQIPPLTNMIFHHPGTFDSCLEVDSKLSPYQQTQVITMINSNNDDDDDDAHQAKSEKLAGKHCLLTSYYRNSFYFEGAHQR